MSKTNLNRQEIRNKRIPPKYLFLLLVIVIASFLLLQNLEKVAVNTYLYLLSCILTVFIPFMLMYVTFKRFLAAYEYIIKNNELIISKVKKKSKLPILIIPIPLILEVEFLGKIDYSKMKKDNLLLWGNREYENYVIIYNNAGKKRALLLQGEKCFMEKIKKSIKSKGH